MLVFTDEINKILKEIPDRPIKERGVQLKYNKKFCIKIISEMAQGKDKYSVATELGISYQTFNIWRKFYPEFDYACKIGEQLTIRYWKELGRINLGNKNFQYVGWMMNMTNRTRWIAARNKDIRTIKKIDKKELEIKINDERVARIVNLSRNNKTIVDSIRTITEEQPIYQGHSV